MHALHDGRYETGGDFGGAAAKHRVPGLTPYLGNSLTDSEGGGAWPQNQPVFFNTLDDAPESESESGSDICDEEDL